MDIVGLFLSLIVGLFIYAGSLCGVRYLKEKKFLDFSISMTFGMLVALILFRLIPDSFKTINGEIGMLKCIISFIVSILIGFFLMKILDMFIKNHNIKSKGRLLHLSMMSIISFIFLNLINGASIYNLYLNDAVKGVVLSFLLCVSNIVLGLFIVSTLIKKLEEKKVLKISFLISLSTLVGYIITSIFLSNILFIGIIKAILIGVLIYLSIYELFYQIYYSKDKKASKLGVYIGIIIIVFLSILRLIIK